MRAVRTILLTIFLAMLVVPAPAPAAVASWPGRTITFWDASGERNAVNRAVVAWNASGVRMRFVRATSLRRAQLVIRNQPRLSCGDGLASTGYPGAGRQAVLWVRHVAIPTTQTCAWPSQTLVVAHELGHVLGLEHELRACSVMNPGITDGVAPVRCFGSGFDPDLATDAMSGVWRCRILEAVDVRRAIRRYGGTAAPVRRYPWCNLFPTPTTPTMAATVPGGFNDRILVSVVRPADQPLVAWLRPQSFLQPALQVHATAGACATRPLTDLDAPDTEVVRTVAWSTTTVGGTLEVLYWPLTPGATYCVAAWNRNALGKYGARSTTITVTVPAEATA
jgi:hypothetical protein